MALDNIPTLGPGSLNGNLDKVLVYKNGGSEVAVSLLTLTNSALSLSGIYLDSTNQRVGIGTTTPVNLLSIDSTNSTLPTEHSAAAATIKSSVQSPLRVLRTAGQPNVWIGTSSTTPNVSSFLFGIRTGAYYNTATPTYSGDYAAWIVSRANDWGVATSASDLRMSQAFTCNGNTARAALAILPIPVETATNTDMVNMNNLLIATAGLFTAQPLARLQIIGDGSTSATTSLLVQNSAGTELLKVQDDGIMIGRIVQSNNFFSVANEGIYTTTSIYGLQLISPSYNVRVGSSNLGSAGDASAMFQVDSTTKGFLKPRLTTAQKNAIATPAAGLEIYDTDLNRPCFYNGTSWITL
jgi:hypothetical protein